MKTSAKGRKFIHLHEGNPLTAYWDPATPPVATVGPGLTNKSATVTRMIGKIVPGKTKLTPETADRVFAAVLAEEVEPHVGAGMPGAKQHEFDAAASGSYNLGAKRFMGWTWAKLWREGQKDAAWNHLANNYNTAGGAKLPGLVRRRKEEATLGRTGFYTGIDGGVAPEGVPRSETGKPATGDPVVREAQELLTARGFDPGAIDGWMGARTKAAIIAYQEAHPHLIADGILGPATLSQLRRDAQAVGQVVKDTAAKGGGTAGALGLVSFFSGLPWHIIVPVILVGALAFFAWRYRDVISRRINTMRGKVVDT